MISESKNKLSVRSRELMNPHKEVTLMRSVDFALLILLLLVCVTKLH